MELDELFKKFNENSRVLLFLGAGFSTYAKNQFGNKLPTGGNLAEYFYTTCGISDGDTDLQFAAQQYLNKFGKQKIKEVLKNSFTVSNYDDFYKNYAEHDFFRIYTTNYDDLLEKVFSHTCKKIYPASIEENSASVKNKDKVILHLNGFIGNISDANLENYFKLTSKSYLVDTITKSSWYEQLQNDIKIADVIMFIGFSFSNDIDIKRLFFSTTDIKKKSYFIVAENEPSINKLKLSELGQVLPCGVEKFSQGLATCTKLKKDKNIENFICFKNFTFDSATTAVPTSKDVFDLLFYGKMALSFISLGIYSESSTYTVRREIIDDIMQAVFAQKTVVIHSDMGNGKTVLLYQLGYSLLKAGYKVLKFEKPYQEFDLELDRISGISEKVVIIVDKYAQYFPAIKKMIKILKSGNVSFIMAERSATFEYSYYDLDMLLEKDFQEFDINRLNDIDIESLTNYITTNNFWGMHSSRSDEDKIGLFHATYKRQIRYFLLDVLKSEDIKNRMKSLLAKFESNESAYTLFLMILVFDAIGLNPDVNDILSLLSFNIDIAELKNDIDYSEFLSFESGDIYIKSPILSLSLLDLVDNKEKLLHLLIQTAKKAASMHSKTAEQYIRNITIFSNIEMIFHGNTNTLSHITYFYDNVKDLNHCKNNPSFWVQYAIVMITTENLEQAHIYIDSAYSYASKIPNYDTYRIDNQYSRLLMEICLEKRPTNHFAILQTAHDLISTPKTIGEQKYYPYRVAAKYYDYYVQYYSSLSLTEKKLFIGYCEKMYGYAKNAERKITSEKGQQKINSFFRAITPILKKEDSQFFKP